MNAEEQRIHDHAMDLVCKQGTEIERLRKVRDEERAAYLNASRERDELRARLERSPDHPYDGIACRDETIKLQDERIEKLRAYAVSLAEQLRYWLPDPVDVAPEEMDRHQEALALLAKNPNGGNAGHHTSVAAHGQRGAEYPTHSEFETWHQGFDPYPWIVCEPSGQRWGPFPTNASASKWADDNKIDTCDFEEVMPPPELRHQSGKKP